MRACVLAGAVDASSNFTMLRRNIARLRGWACVVYGSTRGAASLAGLSPRCALLDPPEDGGRWHWGGLLFAAAAAIPTNSTHVMVLLDDVDLAHVSISRLMHTFDAHGAAVMSPRVEGATYSQMHLARQRPVSKVDAIETYATVFTARSFACFARMIEVTSAAFPLRSIVGWGYDRCFDGFCNGSSYIAQRELALHTGRRRIRGDDLVIRAGMAQLRHLVLATERATGRPCGSYRTKD